jgi:hypothetical protein
MQLFFDRMRRKRHTSVYDAAGAVSAAVAKFAVEKAERLTGLIESLLENT